MALDPERVALFLHEPRGWTMAGHGGPGLAALARETLDSEARWTDELDDPDRIAAFAARHADPDPAVRRAALTELAALPYARLREIEVALDLRWIRARLADTAWFGWWPLLTHMLGLHPDPAAAELLRARAAGGSAATRTPLFVALIEVDGPGALRAALARAPGSGAELAAVQALVTHAQAAAPGEAGGLAAALRDLGSRSPALAASAAMGLLRLEDDGLLPYARQALRDGVEDDRTATLLGYYVAVAGGGPVRGPRPAVAPGCLRASCSGMVLRAGGGE
jgi:hypothetical protein